MSQAIFCLLVLALGVFATTCDAQEPAKQISVEHFGAIPDDGRNDASQLRKAVGYCRNHPGTILYFPPGVYNFRDEKAVQLMDDVMTGKIKGNPQDTIFKPYYPYVKALDFDGDHDVTVDAAGAILFCDGWMQPVTLEHCKNVKIKGLTIDYKRKPYSDGEIVDVQPDYYDAVFDIIYPVSSNMPMCRTMFWDTKAHQILDNEDYFPKYELIAPQKLRIYSRIGQGLKGDLVMISHSFHFRPAIFILEAENIGIEDVTIYCQPGMGVLGQHSKDITLTGLRVVPSPGQGQSTDTDASHFADCTGFIRYKDCQLQGSGDDAIAIQNYYYNIEKPANEEGYDLYVTNADLHAGVLDYPDVGDTLELVNQASLAVVDTFIVKTVNNNVPRLLSRVTLNKELPPDLGKYYLINASRLPKIDIIGCSITSNRARGIQIKGRNVLIERCTIEDTSGTGIQIGSEAYWHEGPTADNVTIRHNRILRCGGGEGNSGACGIVVDVFSPDETVPGLQKHILIEGNIIEGEDAQNGISISGASDVIIRYNEITGCITPVKVRYTDNVNVYANGGG